MTAPPNDIDKLDNQGLRSLLLQVLEENAALRAEVAALREENRRLKGLKGPPAIKPSKPSGMDKATAAKPRKPGRRGPKTPRVAVDEVVLPAEVPPRSRFKGYEDFVVQELVVEPRVTRYRRASPPEPKSVNRRIGVFQYAVIRLKPQTKTAAVRLHRKKQSGPAWRRPRCVAS